MAWYKFGCEATGRGTKWEVKSCHERIIVIVGRALQHLDASNTETALLLFIHSFMYPSPQCSVLETVGYIIHLSWKPNIVFLHSSLYLLPEEVVTTLPAFAPRATADVVISVPVRKFLEFRTIPVIEPSAFCRNLPMMGMSSAMGAAAFFGTVAFGATLPPKNPTSDDGLAFFASTFFSTTGATTFGASTTLGALKSEKVADLSTFFFSTTTGTVFGANEAGLVPLKMLNVPDPWTLFVPDPCTGAFCGGVVVFFALKRESVGDALRAGMGTDLGASAFGGGMEDFFAFSRVRVGDGLRAGTGTGLDTLGSGLGAAGLKKLNGSDFGEGFFSTTFGSDGGEGEAFFASDLVPKKEFSVSVMALGAMMISAGAVFRTSGTAEAGLG